MQSLLLGFFIFSLTQTISAASETCYYPNGSPLPITNNFYSGFVPCSSPGPATICCASNRTNPAGGDSSKGGWTADECLPNGLCQNRKKTAGVETTTFFANFCTDSNFTSGACLNICEQTRTPTGNMQMTSCNGRADGTEWCCGDKNTACCGSGVGVVKIPQKFLGRVASSSSVSKTISTSTPTSSPLGRVASSSSVSKTISTSTSTSSPLPEPNRSPALSGGVIAGIVLGAIILISMLALALYFCLRKKRVAPSTSSHPQIAEVEAPRRPPAYEVGSGQETASEKYAVREPVELMVLPVELAGGGEYGRGSGVGR